MEKEIEDWLESETRILVIPDGSSRSLTSFRLLWSIYEDVLNAGFTQEKIIGWTLEEVELQGTPFETAFQGVLAYVDDHVRQG